MLKLSELKISPAPWSFVKSNRDYEVSDSEDFGLSYEDRYELPDARLIAAAPDLYEALYDVVAYCESTHLVPSERFGKVLAKVKAALAKAAGESEAER